MSLLKVLRLTLNSDECSSKGNIKFSSSANIILAFWLGEYFFLQCSLC